MYKFRFQRQFTVASIVLACSTFSLVSAATPQSKPPKTPPPAPVLRDYSERLVIPNDGSTCALHANALATNFASMTTAQNVTGTCTSQQTITGGYKVDVIVIAYQAENEILPYRAIFGGASFMGNPDASTGLIASYADCLQALSMAQNSFAANTGLTPFVGYCQPADATYEQGFSPVLEAYGTPATRLRVFRPNENMSEDFTNVTAAAAPMIQKYDGNVVYQDNTRVFYYTKGSAQVSVFAGPGFSTTAECQSQLANVKNMYASVKDSDVTVVCNGTGASLNLFAVGVKANYLGEAFNRTSPYFSYSDCQTDGPRVITNLKSRGSRAVGFLCTASFSAGKYDMHIYERLFYANSPHFMYVK